MESDKNETNSKMNYGKRDDGRTGENRGTGHKGTGYKGTGNSANRTSVKPAEKSRNSNRTRVSDKADDNSIFTKNQIIELEIVDIGSDGEGVGRHEGVALFVKGAVIGDVIHAQIMRMKKTYGYARIQDIITPSPWRVKPVCKVAGPCGGCQLQHLDYQKQLEYKQNKIVNSLIRIGGLTEVPMEPIIGMEEPYYFRNKSQFPVGRDKDGNVSIGFFAEHTHSIIDTEFCYIQDKTMQPVLEVIRTFIQEYKISTYDEEQRKGLIRHILIRTGLTTGEVMVCLIVNGNSVPNIQVLVDRLKGIDFKKELAKLDSNDVLHLNNGDGKKTEDQTGKTDGMLDQTDGTMPIIKSICMNVNREDTNVILGEKIYPIYGDTYITDYIGDISFQISPHSFFQVNPKQTRALYETALEFAGLHGSEVVWDLYCGIGTISLFLAKQAKKVYGVEIIPQAVEDARENVVRNGLTNVEFFVGAAEEVLPKFYEKAELEDGQIVDESAMHPDVIVVDPPRKGCEESLLKTIVQMSPEKVVYVSCDPGTLARDVKFLCANGYEVKRVKAVDQFCHSVHVETVVLMSNVKE